MMKKEPFYRNFKIVFFKQYRCGFYEKHKAETHQLIVPRKEYLNLRVV